MTNLQTNAVRGALTMGGGLLVARLAMARTLMEAVLATGIAGLEIGGVHLIGAKARKLDEEIADYDKAEAANVLAQAATAERERRQELVRETEKQIEAILDKIESRSQKSDAEAAKRRAVAEARHGYLSGVLENRAGSVAPGEGK